MIMLILFVIALFFPSFVLPPIYYPSELFFICFNFTYDYLQILDYTYDQAMTTAQSPCHHHQREWIPGQGTQVLNAFLFITIRLP